MTSLPVPVTAVESHPRASWEEVLAVFLDTLNSRGTRDAYRRGVRSMAHHVVYNLGAPTVVDVTPQHLASYRAELVRQVEIEVITAATVNQRLAGCRRFLEFARLTGQSGLGRDVVAFCLKGLRSTVKRPYQVLSRGEMQRILSVQRPGSRDHALLALMLGTGLRASEVCRLRIEDLASDEAGDLSVRVRQGKGRKDRVVPLAPQVAEAVTAYLREEGRLGSTRANMKGPGEKPPDEGKADSLHDAVHALNRLGARVSVRCAAHNPEKGPLLLVGTDQLGRQVSVQGDEGFVGRIVDELVADSGDKLTPERREKLPLFPSRQGRMSRRRLAQVVAGAVKVAEVTKPISPHSLRHSYGIALLRNGASPVAVGKLLGHASIATTQRYLDHLEAAELKRWALNPL